MQPELEYEQALPTYPAVTSDGSTIDGNKGLVYGLISLLVTGATGAVAWVIKRSRTSNQLEDTTNIITVESLSSLRLRNRELEDQVRSLLGDILSASRAQIDAERAASDAAGKAERAAALAEDARRDADRAVRELRRALAHNALLRSAMISAGLTPPDPPQLDPEP